MVPNGKLKSPMFSVIVPIYNVLHYLKAGLASLVHELTDDLQVILIDDGSTDGSGAVLDEYAKQFPQFEVVHQPNGGVAAARNRGLERARGEYILWLDPDDYVLPGWLGAIRAAVERYAPDMLLFDFVQEQNGQQTPKCYGRPAGAVQRNVFFSDLVRDLRLTSVLWNKVIRRSFFENTHFDESLRCLEDYVLLYQIAFEMFNIVYLPEHLYAYRIREDGLVRSPNLQIGFQSYLESIKRMEQFKALGLPSHALGTLLQAKGFCCKYYLCQMPKEYRREYGICKRLLLGHAFTVLADRELPWGEKCKYLLIPFAPVGKLYARKAACGING